MTTKVIKQKKKKAYDSWIVVTFVLLAFYLLFMLFPMGSLLKQSFFDKVTGAFTLQNYSKFFALKQNYLSLVHSFEVSICVTLLALIVGVPLAYFTTCYKIKFSKTIRTTVILSSMSAPFIGAYAWIELFGNNGRITSAISKAIGVQFPSIYGFKGIVLVMTFNLMTLVYLYVCGALKNVDNSLVEASSNLGVDGIKRFFKVIIPLIMPTILASALMVFMRAFADFGTPVLIGRNYKVFTVLIRDEYVSEMGSDKAYAAALSVLAIIITTIVFLIQKYINSKYSFTMNALHPIEKKKAKPLANVLMHFYCYFITIMAFLPQLFVIYSAFQNSNGFMFTEGYSLNSFKVALKRYGDSIPNTFKIGLGALAIVIIMSVLIAYLVVRRKNVANQTLDIMTMVPYVIPGSVIGVAMIVAFNKEVLFLPALHGTAALMIIALVIRRSPYTIRSSVAVLQQISLSIEEASLSLGASKAKTFFKVTLPMMMNGIVSGAILSWVSIVTELSTSIYLFSKDTMTMTVAIYTFANNGTYGYASAMAAILTGLTIISLIIYNIATKGEGDGIA